MSHRFTSSLTALVVILALLFTCAASQITSGAGPLSQAQPDPTSQAATINAVVNSFFTQTAEAQAQFAVTQTVEAAFGQAQTATAAFQATVNFEFGQELTATAAFRATVSSQFSQALTATARAPFDAYTARITKETEMTAGPGYSGAFLLPTGTGFVYYGGNEGLCVYNIEAEPMRCNPSFRETVDGFVEYIQVSPDGHYATFTTDFMRSFRDSDIWLFDTQSGEITNLTDDGVEGDVILRGGKTASIDLSPQWLPDSRTILFVRYAIVDGQRENVKPQLMKVDVGGTGIEQVGVLPSGPLQIGAMAVSPDGQQIAFSVEPGQDGAERALWVSGSGGQNARPIYQPDQPAEALFFSADGQYLMVVLHTDRTQSCFGQSRILLISVESNATRLVDTIQDFECITLAGWAPQGSGLAYVLESYASQERAGLYIKPSPNEPGRLVLQGETLGGTDGYHRRLQWEGESLLLTIRGGGHMFVLSLGEN